MNKQAFLDALQDGLSGLPSNDINERIVFYTEMIDDYMEDGLSEADAVCQVGNVEQIIAGILSEMPVSSDPEPVKLPKRKLRSWEILLLILGLPLWLPLLIAAAAVALSLYVVIWSLIISLWAVFGSLIASGLAVIVGGVIMICTSNPLPGIAVIGAGMVSIGLSIFMYFVSFWATRGTVKLTKQFFLLFKKSKTIKEETL